MSPAMQPSEMTEYERIRRKKMLETQNRLLELSMLTKEVKRECMTLQGAKRKELTALPADATEKYNTPRRRSGRSVTVTEYPWKRVIERAHWGMKPSLLHGYSDELVQYGQTTSFSVATLWFATYSRYH